MAGAAPGAVSAAPPPAREVAAIAQLRAQRIFTPLLPLFLLLGRRARKASPEAAAAELVTARNALLAAQRLADDRASEAR